MVSMEQQSPSKMCYIHKWGFGDVDNHPDLKSAVGLLLFRVFGGVCLVLICLRGFFRHLFQTGKCS